jgi:antitoxin VapB
MAIYLKDADVDRLAREVARLEGTSLTEAVERALADRRAKLLAAREEKRKRAEATLARIRALPVLDPRSPDEILYDKDGVPK